MQFSSCLVSAVALCAAATAQVPDGWYVLGAFSPNRGPVGLFVSHPRTPAPPTPVTGLFGDLVSSGASSCLYHGADGTVIVGERVFGSSNHSVDIHVITLEGTRVYRDLVFSVGVGGGCCGEIPQAAVLSDGRIVVAATDIQSGPLATLATTSYGNEGVGILDPESGLVTPLPIDNPPQLMIDGVFNGLAVSPDEQTIYISDYYSGTAGHIWSLPITGGTPSLVAVVPSGCSNLCFDGDGDLWVTGLGTTAGSLFEVDVTTGNFTVIAPPPGPIHPIGTANAIGFERTTGNLVVASANSGTPPRSLYWMEPDGAEHLLSTPGLGTISGVDVNPNPETYGDGSPGATAYGWVTAPHPGGLPLAGNAAFSLTLEATGPMPNFGAVILSTQRLAPPFPVLGIDLLVDPSTTLATLPIAGAPTMTVPLGIPGSTGAGLAVRVQSIHVDGSGFAASDGLEFTVL